MDLIKSTMKRLPPKTLKIPTFPCAQVKTMYRSGCLTLRALSLFTTLSFRFTHIRILSKLNSGNKTNLFSLIIDSSKDAMSGLIYMWNFRLMLGCGVLVDSSEEIKGLFQL
ncbi:unnamed protein product [Rotaria magnacalcarata]|uniref:Uncharacterized protein n=3 Tax=Rotaria magnacalcarata TaxID=392030 RepID=A0A819SM25_9BILA|nr:unnamed protein product [Rotaria magnacalcarata]